MRHLAAPIWALYALQVLQLAQVALATEPAAAAYVLDLWAAPWSNIGLSAIAAQLGGLWGFLHKLTKNEIPVDRAMLHFARDMLGAMLVGIVLILLADLRGMTVGASLLMVLGGGIGWSMLIEKISALGSSIGKPNL